MFQPRTFLPLALLAPAALILVATAPLQARDMDGKIESSIKSSYNFKTYLASENISVHSDEGVVVLSGNVSNSYQRDLAYETAIGMGGVRSVKNELTVTGMPTENSDAWVTMKVKGALAYHKNVSALGTEVYTNDGVVVLKGHADNDAQRALTAEYAADVEGVKRVDNQLELKGHRAPETAGEKIDDASITAQIKTSLLFHRSTHALATRVKTHRGVVVLHGEAANAAERGLVGKLAEDIHGVRRVDNRMTINPS